MINTYLGQMGTFMFYIYRKVYHLAHFVLVKGRCQSVICFCFEVFRFSHQVGNNEYVKELQQWLVWDANSIWNEFLLVCVIRIPIVEVVLTTIRELHTPRSDSSDTLILNTTLPLILHHSFLTNSTGRLYQQGR